MISVLLSGRPSYAKLKPVLGALWRLDTDHRLEVVACAGALLHRFGRIVDQVRLDFPWLAVSTIYSAYDGSTVETSVKETASLLSSLAEHYARTKPRLVVVMADRHETAAASLAAAYQNIPVAHIQGGERSGNIDDRVRDVNTCLATLHFPATVRAHHRLSMFANAQSFVYQFGCPSIDLAKAAQQRPPAARASEFGGTGPDIDLRHPFLLLLLHPETERPEDAHEQMQIVLNACAGVNLPKLGIWPGQDAGQEGGAKAIREYRITWPSETFHMVRTIPPEAFLRLLSQTAVLVGNSSAGIREGAYIGTPVVNIGERQAYREQATNVIDVPFNVDAIRVAINAQLKLGFAPSSTLYGRGDAGERIAAKLLEHAWGRP